MAKDILLIGHLGQYNVLFFFDQIKEATKENPDEEMIVRVNTTGGSPDYMMSIMEKIQENSANMFIKGNAQVHSAGLFAMCYVPADRVECLDVTQAVLHRAAFDSWMEKHPDFPESSYAITLAKTNKDLEKALRARVDVEVLENLPQMKEKNLKIKDIFSMDSRIDIVLTGADLKKIGLVSKVNKLTPSKTAEMESEFKAFDKLDPKLATLQDYRSAAKATLPPTPEKETETKNNTVMTIDELKLKHPEVYASVYKAGVDAEKERVEGIMVFAEIDVAACKAAIESGKDLTAKQKNEFLLKQTSSAALKDIKDDSSKALTTEENKDATNKNAAAKGAQTEEQKKKAESIASFETDLDKRLGLDKNKAA